MFASLGERALDDVATASTVSDHARGAVRTGEHPTAVHLLVSGILRVFVTSPDGSELPGYHRFCQVGATGGQPTSAKPHSSAIRWAWSLLGCTYQPPPSTNPT